MRVLRSRGRGLRAVVPLAPELGEKLCGTCCWVTVSIAYKSMFTPTIRGQGPTTVCALAPLYSTVLLAEKFRVEKFAGKLFPTFSVVFAASVSVPPTALRLAVKLARSSVPELTAKSPPRVRLPDNVAVPVDLLTVK